MQRYLLRQPNELEEMASVKMGDWIASKAEMLILSLSELYDTDADAAEASLSRHIDTIRNCLNATVPRIYHDTVTTEAIRALKKTSRSIKTKTDCQMNVITRMIETLFSKNLTSLLLLYDTFPMFQSSFCSKSYMLTGLVDLKIDYHANEADLIQFLKELHGLKYLEIRYCRENILRCIADNCKLIEELDLSLSEWHPNDYSSMKMLAQLNNLRVLNQESLVWLGSDGFQILLSILFSCENMEHINLGVQNTKMLLEVFKHIASDKENAGKQFKLKSYYGKANTVEDLQLVVDTCPLIEKITLFYDETILRNSLEPLVGLQNLRELELGRVSFHEQVKGVIQEIGSHLAHLKLSDINDIDLNALMDISQMCPKLESLSLVINTPIVHTPLDARTLMIAPFRSLNTLKLSSVLQMGLGQTTTGVGTDFEEQLFFLLSNSLNVEFVEIICSVQLSEDKTLKLLDTNSFNYLKQLKILPNNIILAKLLVDHIVENSIAYPEVIVFRNVRNKNRSGIVL